MDEPKNVRVAVIIQPLESADVSCYVEDQSPELAALQELVGGNIEGVRINPDRILALQALIGCPELPKQMIMYVDEEGKYKNRIHNDLATAVAGHPINGTAVVIEVKTEDYG